LTFLLGLADVRTGRLASAERQVEAQRVGDRVNDPRLVWWQHALAGEIALPVAISATPSACGGPEFRSAQSR